MDTLITIAVLIGAAILHALNKRRQQREESDLPAPPPESAPGETAPPARPRRSQPTNWEEELRRLLEGDEPASPPPRPAPPPLTPPVIVLDQPRPVPPPLPPVIAPRPTPRAQAAPRPQLSSRPAHADPEWAVDKDMLTGLPVQLTGLTQSAAAHQRASTLEQRVTAHLERVSQGITTHEKAAQFRRVSPEIGHALRLLRGRQSARTAFVLATILGPPRGLEH